MLNDWDGEPLPIPYTPDERDGRDFDVRVDPEADVCDCGQCAGCAESAQCAAEAKEDR
jgi:hypothetical protein